MNSTKSTFTYRFNTVHQNSFNDSTGCTINVSLNQRETAQRAFCHSVLEREREKASQQTVYERVYVQYTRDNDKRLKRGVGIMREETRNAIWKQQLIIALLERDNRCPMRDSAA